MSTAVSVRHLRKQYGGTVAAADVSFEVAEGEIFGLLGPNGSGKTTTVECLQGLRRPDSGELAVFGHDPGTEPAAVRRLTGSQLQESALPDRIRVWEALRLFAVIGPGGPPWQQLLDDWGLTGCRDTAFGDLSGGQRQRLFVALALVSDPRLVVLDEMTTGLDPAARRVAWDLVSAVRDRGRTIILVTHFMDEAEALCDRVGLMVDGRVAVGGTVAELVASAGRSAVVRFTGDPDRGWDHLAAVDGATAVAVHGDQVVVTGTGPLLVRVAARLADLGVEPDDLRVELPSLEDAYLALTGQRAMDEGGHTGARSR